MKKRLLSMLLCLCMAVTLLPTTAHAETKYLGGFTVEVKLGDATFDSKSSTLQLAPGGEYTVMCSYTVQTIELLTPASTKETLIVLDGVTIIQINPLL